ncbi:UBP5-like protein [Saccharomyces kudriavzevii IFO 1802]|uniref:Ubiquitin carboxyl-terminal hydrolase n=1 Tax=Saccharomyces kudriavzevii (strain ATCC MYA-4449 / AS 2.2408 / CBS 8840 / NBRC 1802 / NCYC 2889) TaxID=226230 RepID=J4U4E5_SACK1|nr:UBP5-like protein [Saccharomyces kudriavzevii IFO 1802]
MYISFLFPHKGKGVDAMGSQPPSGEVGESAQDRLDRLRCLVQKFLDDDDVPQESAPLLQECTEVWASYVDACHDIAVRAPREDMNHLSRAFLRLNETAFIYYMIVHAILKDTLPNLDGFPSTIANSARSSYRERMQLLQNDPKIEQIRNVIENYPNLTPLPSIEPSKLSSMLRFHGGSILVIDIRPRSEFIKAHIKCKNIICIEPVSFKDSFTDQQVGKISLATSPQSEIDLFSNRDTFKYIVLYTDTQLYGDFHQRQTRILTKILCQHSVLKPLGGTKVLILANGFSNWVKLGGAYQSFTPDPAQLTSSSSTPSFGNPRVSAELFNQRSHSPPKCKSPSLIVMNTQSQPLQVTAQTPQLPLYYPEVPTISKSRPDKNSSAFQSLSSHPLIALPKVNSSSLFPTKVDGIEKLSANVRNQQIDPYLPSASNVIPPRIPPLPQQNLSPPKHAIFNNSQAFDLDFIVGLENMGNCCYMNCILQCLVGTHDLTRMFLDNTYLNFINFGNTRGSKGLLAKNYATLVHNMHRHGAFKPPHSRTTPVQTLQFKKVCGHINSIYSDSMQQDCQEFCQFLLDGLHEDLNQNGGKKHLKQLSEQEERMRESMSIRKASALEWERFLLTDFSAIIDLFQGQYASRLQCQACEHTSTTYQTFSVLSVPVPRIRTCNILDCFREFTKCEKLGVDEQWSCSKCLKKQPSTKQLKITRLPKKLIINLKRFDNQMNKNNVFVQYPCFLDLTPYWARDFNHESIVNEDIPTRGQIPPFRYRLYGVACHSGSLYGGHYTSYVYKGPQKGWYFFDDSVYCPIRFNDEFITPNAYVLFYERIF